MRNIGIFGCDLYTYFKSILNIYVKIIIPAISQIIFAQSVSDLGTPYIENITQKNTSIYPKYWNLQSAPNGILFGVNENGLVSYDGLNWHVYAGSKGITRSLVVLNNDLIYTGSDMDFGKWEKDVFQNFHYTSLYPLSDKPTSLNEEFWNVYYYKEKVIFQSQHNLYVYEDAYLTKIAAPSFFSGSCLSDQLYLFDQEYGIYTFDGDNLIPYQKFTQANPIALMPIRADHWIFTESDGIWIQKDNEIFPFGHKINALLKSANIFAVQRYLQNYILVGTISDGLYVIDHEGNIIQHINKLKGLTNNTILSISEDVFNNVFVGMNFGISKIHLQWPLDYFIDYKGEWGTASYALLHQNKFYIGTNQGLYVNDWQDMKGNHGNFELLPNSKGQVWSIKYLDHNIWVGHDNGTYLLKNNLLNLVHNEPGTWDMIATDDSHIITGNYDGLHILHKENENWKFQKKIQGVVGSCNHLYYDQAEHELWTVLATSHILKIRLNSNWEISKQDAFFIEDLNFETSKIYSKNNEIYLQTPQHIYLYNKAKNRFNLYANRNESQIPYVSMEKNQAVRVNSQYIFYGFENGFVLKNLFKNEDIKPEQLKIEVRDAVAFNNKQEISMMNDSEIPYSFNNIKLHYTVPQLENALYRYRINEEDWQAWSTDRKLELVNQSEGTYEVQFQCKLGKKLSPIIQFNYKINPPFYRSIWAYLVYIIFLVIVIFLNKRRQTRRLEQQKIAIENQQKEQFRIQEEKLKKSQVLKQSEELRNEIEQLKKDLRTKNKNLTKNATIVNSKNKTISHISELIEQMKKENPSLTESKNFNTIKRILNSNIDQKNEDFSLLFDETNEQFFEKLKKEYPSLTLNNLRLAAYIRAGFTSKEIANIQNVLPSSVIVNRSRLRKKLKLKSETDLYDYLTKF